MADVRAGHSEGLHAEVASVLDWWTVAGVDTAVGESPRDWLAPPPARATPAATPAATATALPPTLAAFEAWLATEGDPALLGPPAARLAPAGPAGAPLMVLVDMPEAEDAEAGRLLAGPAGRMLDRMLAAIGQSRDGVRLASLSPARPGGGRIDAARAAALAPVARHHLGLVAAARLLVLGQCAADALLGRGARGRVHRLVVNDRAVDVVASFGPQALIGAPAAMKRAAWEDLLLLKGTGS